MGAPEPTLAADGQPVYSKTKGNTKIRLITNIVATFLNGCSNSLISWVFKLQSDRTSFVIKINIFEHILIIALLGMLITTFFGNIDNRRKQID